VPCSKDRKSFAVYQVDVFFTEAGWPKNAVKQRAIDLLRKQINFGKDQKLAANDCLATSGLCHNKRTTLYAQHKEILTANNGIHSRNMFQ
jgi:hypothetical protein